MPQEAHAQAETKKISVTVVYNGVEKEITFQPHEAVKAALEQAMNEFNIHDQRHIQAFWKEDGSEITDETQSLEKAGLATGTVLALRPSKVKGGLD